MWEDLSPDGALEESLAQDVINIAWRKRRVIAYESALMSQEAATAKKDWEERNQVSVDLEGIIRFLRRPEPQIPDIECLLQFDSPGKGTKFDRMLAAIDSSWSKGDGVEVPPPSQVSPFQVARLRIYQAEKAVIGSRGKDLSNPALQNAVVDLAQRWATNVRRILGPSLGQVYSAGDIEALITAACGPEEIIREEFWAELDELVLDRLETAISALNELELEARREIQLASLPDEASLAKIQRYEVHFSRQHDKALHELQRLQVARLSRQPSAPVAVDVNLDTQGL